MATTRNLLALSFLSVISAVSTVNAQSLPAEGTLSVTFTATQTSPMKPFPIGDGKAYDVLNAAMTASNDTGNPVLNKMAGTVLSVELGKSPRIKWSSMAIAPMSITV